MKVRKAEAETIVFNNSPRAMLEVAIYMIVVLAYYLLIFNNQNTNENYILSRELATILICFLRLTSIANQIYGCGIAKRQQFSIGGNDNYSKDFEFF